MVKGRGRRSRAAAEMVTVAVLLLCCIWSWSPSFANGNTDPNDVAALNALYTNLNSASQLNGWIVNGGDPCGQAWLGITCSGSNVTAIKLSGMGLTGRLSYNLNIMASLADLDLSNNNIGGGTSIPYNLPLTLQTLNLGGNQFTGTIPYSISLMVSLKYLNLNHNQLQGSLQDFFSQMTNLTMMDLSYNTLTGDLPQSISSLSRLTTLYLQNNQFTGTINVLANLPLTDLNIANNQFTGWIPDQLKKINNLQTGGNSWSNGPAPPPPPYAPPPPSPPNNPSSNANRPSASGKSSGIGGGGIAGIIISAFIVCGIVAFFFVKRKPWTSSRDESTDQDQSFAPLASSEFKEMKSIQIDPPTVPPAAPISLKLPPKMQKSLAEDDFPSSFVVKKTDTTPIKAAVYSIADLQIATDSFSVDSLVGEGSFGRVYKARFKDEKILAVKKMKSTLLPQLSSDDFIKLASDISVLHHPNLTELVGYCAEHGQHLLVYEFFRNGSLHDLLHFSEEHSKPLSWNNRVKIALGSARALEYLHEVCSPSIVHKHFKSTNILLDTDLNPHISDCGFANLVADQELQASEQNSGYGAPEVTMSGQYTLKSDIYSFGVVMLELLTGRKPFDSSRPRSEQLLVRWATPQLHDIDALDQMVDPALKGLYPAKSLSRFADVIALCVQSEPEFRPPMSEVVQALVRLAQRANMSARILGRDGSENFSAS